MKTSSLLLILVVIFTFPIWIGLAGGLFGITIGLAGGLFGMVMGLFGAIIGVVASVFKFLFMGVTGFHDFHGLHFFSHPAIWMTCLIVAAIIIFSANRNKR